MQIEEIPNGELVSLLFLKDTLQSVKTLFSSTSKGLPVKTDWPVRLQKANAERINLQMIINSNPVIDEDSQYISEGRRTAKQYRFFKMLGSYELKNDQITVRIPLAFQETAKLLSDNQLNEIDIPILDFNFLDNALIGAFSVEAFNDFARHEDIRGRYFNRLKMDMYMTFDNDYPQCFLDDQYGISKPLSAFSKENKSFMHLEPYTERVKQLYSEGILDDFN